MIRASIAVASLALLVACAVNGGTGENTSSLAGTTWRLAELQSNEIIVRPDDPAKYEMTLGEDGRAVLRLDCNRGTGGWSSDAANQIAFTLLAITNAACPEGSLDTRVARDLGYVRTYMLEGDTLRLIMMADGGSQVWTRQR